MKCQKLFDFNKLHFELKCILLAIIGLACPMMCIYKTFALSWSLINCPDLSPTNEIPSHFLKHTLIQLMVDSTVMSWPSPAAAKHLQSHDTSTVPPCFTLLHYFKVTNQLFKWNHISIISVYNPLLKFNLKFLFFLRKYTFPHCIRTFHRL